MKFSDYGGPPSQRPTVSCLCATKGRFGFLAKAIAYYDIQDYPNKQLIIFNNSEVPITLSAELQDRKDIKLINAGEFNCISDVYNSAITFCDSKYTAIWDDDDMYFPWHLSQGIKILEETGGDAYKPEIQLMWMHNNDCEDVVEAVSNSCEGSNIICTKILKSSGFGNPTCPESPQHPHPRWQNNVKKWVFGNTKTENFADPSYVYIWNGSLHTTGHLSQGFEYYDRNNNDTGEGKVLQPANIWEDYIGVFNLLNNKYPEPLSEKFSEEEKEDLRCKFKKYGSLEHINVIDLANHDTNLIPSRDNIFFYWEDGYHPFSEHQKSGRADITKTALWTTCKFNPTRKVYLFSNDAQPEDYAHRDVKFTIVRYSYDDLVRNTPLERNALARKIYGNETNPRIICDIYRIIFLYKWGGSYVDTDNICIQPITDKTSNIISRTFDLADVHWCNILSKDSSEEELGAACLPGVLRENGTYPKTPFFVRMDGWLNWDAKHVLLRRMLEGQVLDDRGECLAYGNNHWAYSPPTWLYRTLTDHFDQIKNDVTVGLSLVYLYEAFMSNDFGVSHREGELLDIYLKVVPPFFPDFNATGEEFENLTCDEKLAKVFLKECKKTFPYGAFLWMCDKEENKELKEDSGPARLSSWLYRLAKKATKY